MTTEEMQNLKDCATSCWNCRNTCQTTLFLHCLPEGGAHAAQEHVRLMIDCMELCQAAADLITRQSPLHAHACLACAEACLACAESCENVGGTKMEKCAQACRDCAAACQGMAGDAAPGYQDRAA